MLIRMYIRSIISSLCKRYDNNEPRKGKRLVSLFSVRFSLVVCECSIHKNESPSFPSVKDCADRRAKNAPTSCLHGNIGDGEIRRVVQRGGICGRLQRHFPDLDENHEIRGDRADYLKKE